MKEKRSYLTRMLSGFGKGLIIGTLTGVLTALIFTGVAPFLGEAIGLISQSGLESIIGMQEFMSSPYGPGALFGLSSAVSGAMISYLETRSHNSAIDRGETPEVAEVRAISDGFTLQPEKQQAKVQTPETNPAIKQILANGPQSHLKQAQATITNQEIQL